MEKKECNNMTLNSTTRIGMTAGQVIWLLTVAATFTLGYADLNARITDIEARQMEIRSMCDKQGDINSKLTETTFDIKQSLIRIEGKLDLKQDRFK